MPCTGSVNYSHRRFYHRTPKCGRCQVWSGYYNKCMDVKKERYGHHVQNELYPVFFVTFTNYSQDIHLNRNVVGAYSHKCGQCGVWSYRFCKCVRRTFCDLKPKPKPETGGMNRLYSVKTDILKNAFFWYFFIRNELSRVDLIIKIVLEFLSNL